MPGAAGHEAPPPAARPRGTHFVQDAASPLIVGPEPAAALVRARGRSARRTPTPVRGADPAGDPGETFLSRGERARPGVRGGCATLRGGGGGADPEPEQELAGARVSGPRGVVAGAGTRLRAAAHTGCRRFPLCGAGIEPRGELSPVPRGGCGLGSGEALE